MNNNIILEYERRIKGLYKEIRDLNHELKEAKKIELEAVRRYERVADELLLYYIKYGKLDIKERKKKK